MRTAGPSSSRTSTSPKLFLSDDEGYVTGATFRIDGGATL
jgi:hypothetical protein